MSLFCSPALALSSRSAPLAPEFLESRGRTSAVVGAETTGYRHGPLDLSHLAGKRVFGRTLSRTATFPASYDLRSLGRITPVRDQQSAGTCWAHAALASIESNILTQGGDAMSFSPQHLSWFVFKAPAAFTTEQRYFDDDPARPYAPNVNVFQQGGWDWQAVAALARRIGPVAEAECPYGPFPNSPAEISPDRIPTGNETVLRRLQHAYYLAGPYDPIGLQSFDLPAHEAFVENVKTALQTYGGVVLVYDALRQYMNASKDAFYHPAGQGTIEANHAVLLVGWDDSYPKENMVVSGDDGAGYTPPADGAWIFKNSWGTDAGNAGYYRISYYSAVLWSGTAYVTDSAANDEAVYDHDPLGWVNGHGYPGSDTAFFANVFTAGTPSSPLGKAAAAGSATSESLRAVSFYSGAPDSGYEIRVYRGGSAGDPTSGTLVSGPQAGVLETPGYHTVALDSAPTLSAGERFAVVVRLRTPGYLYPIPVEYAIAGYSDAATASAGQGYISANGTTWEDASLFHNGTMSVCLKAFTKTVATTPTVTQGDKGSGGGCTAAAEGAPLALLLFVPLLLTRK
jgi:C1A family cysteine protease